MNIELIAVGKTDSKAVEQIVEQYCKRIGFYTNYTTTLLPDIKNSKNLSCDQQKVAEGLMILKRLEGADFVVLLDEGGAQRSSVEFATWLNKRMVSGVRRLVFVIGGPYGFSPEVYAKASEKLSLSPMTFSHQIIRAIFAEQLYRCLTIIKGVPYHHQ